MDFEKLSEILPKAPEKWTIEDVGKWLNFIGLSNQVENFRKQNKIKPSLRT